jgi:protoporphyrinogen oxidase
MTDVRLGYEMIMIDPKNHTLSFANQQTDEYDQVISSIPLPELIPRIKGVPSEVKSAAKILACTSCIIINIGIDREKISDSYWTYFYDHDIIFSRLSFPHMFSPYNVPKNAGSIQAEIYYSLKYKPLQYSIDECTSKTLSDLERCGLITKEDNIIFVEAREIPYANIIFDLDRRRCLSIVHNYLDKIGIYYCGRYGEWGYHWTDQSFKSGENAAREIVNKLNS